MLSKSYILIGLVLALAGCASQQAKFAPIAAHTSLADINEWQLRGKIVVRNTEDAEKAKFTWRNDKLDYRIRLSGTLGMGTTYIYGNPQEVRLEQSGKEPVYAATPEQLVWDQLGQEIPISQLQYWVRGLSAPDFPIDEQERNAEGLFMQLAQAGWQLRYSDYIAVGRWHLPNNIEAHRDDISLTISVANWQLPETPL